MLTLLAMLAFAANSLLCQLALGGELIDAASFTLKRRPPARAIHGRRARQH